MRGCVHTFDYLSALGKSIRTTVLIGILVCGLFTVSCPVQKDRGSRPSLEGVFGEVTAGDEEEAIFEADDPDGGGVDAADESRREEVRLARVVPMDPAPLERFFEALEAMDEEGEGTVRILHWGDSHTAADFVTTAIRRPLQDRFGDGGRGFVLLGKPWRSYRPKDVITGARGDWSPERIRIALDPATLDGYYGLGGVTVDAAAAGSATWVATTDATGYGEEASAFEVFYLIQPGGGTFEVTLDGEVRATVNTAGKKKRTGFVSVEAEEGSHELRVEVKGGGPVRLFGATVQNDGPGIVYDSLGVNGGFFYTPLRWDEETLAEQVERRDPDLLVTMYGSNEADSRTIDPGSYKDKVLRAMERFREGAPDASCLMLGPPDRRFEVSREKRLEQLAWIIEVQREVAEQIGCSFVDLREIMGGPGSHERWGLHSPPLAQPDGVHLTVRGYEELGSGVAARMIEAYETWSEDRDREQ